MSQVKMNPSGELIARIDKFLWRRGFERGLVRTVTRTAILLSGILFPLGLILLPFTSWFFWLGCGAILSAWNFFSMADYLTKNFPLINAQSKTSSRLIAGQLWRWILRLFIVVFLVYVALVHCGANPFALLLGLGLTVLCMPVLLFGRNN